MGERLRLAALGLLASGLGVLLVAGAAAADDAGPLGTSAAAAETPTETSSGSPSPTPTSASPSASPSQSTSESPTESPSESPTSSPSASPTPSTTPGTTPSPSTSPTAPTGPVTVDDAVLRWGVNNESNNKAFAPRTFNFFSAGLLPDPGQGGVTVKQAQWQQSAGSTGIEKWNGSVWQPATWAGLSTDSAGNELTSPTEGRFSNHAFVMSGGTGTVDRGAGTAQVAWDGDVTVLYYSGMSFFHLSDPVLDVAGGRGTLTAVLHGYRSSQSDPGVWEDVAPRRVTIADLPAVDLADIVGFVAAPAYLGVRVTGVPQVTDGAAAGSFPQSFVDYLDQLGAAAFWYSSGAATDPFKAALPLTVSYDARVPVVAPQPTDETTATDLPTVSEPTAVNPPSATPNVPVTGGVAAPVGAAPPAAPAPGVAAGEDAYALLARPATDVRLLAAPVTPDPAVAASTSRLWWLGGGLLLAAALVLLVPGTTTRRVTAAP